MNVYGERPEVSVEWHSQLCSVLIIFSFLSCVYLCGRVTALACIWRSDTTCRSHFSLSLIELRSLGATASVLTHWDILPTLPIYVLRQGIYWTWSSLIHLDWLAGKRRDPPVSASPVLELQILIAALFGLLLLLCCFNLGPGGSSSSPWTPSFPAPTTKELGLWVCAVGPLPPNLFKTNKDFGFDALHFLFFPQNKRLIPWCIRM